MKKIEELKLAIKALENKVRENKLRQEYIRRLKLQKGNDMKKQIVDTKHYKFQPNWKTKLSKITKLRFKGYTQLQACEKEKVAISTFHNWVKRGRKSGIKLPKGRVLA